MKKFILGFVLGSTLPGLFNFGLWAWDQNPRQLEIERDYQETLNAQKQQQIDRLQREQYNRERQIQKEPC